MENSNGNNEITSARQQNSTANVPKRSNGKKKSKKNNKYKLDFNTEQNLKRNDEPEDNANTYPPSDMVGANMKSSLSMISLAANDNIDNRNILKERLKIERPYNSLKKGTTTETSKCKNENLNRFSWGSINSYSSSSLHSGTTLGLSCCKDDLWAAIQTNYNYIMDTNLLDSCKEARCEIEGGPNVLESPIKYSKMLDESNPCANLYGDLKELRKWLQEMEEKLENAPTVSEATSFPITKLQHFLEEHSALYHEIVSHARVVSSCIRAATEKGQQQIKDIKIHQPNFDDSIDPSYLLSALPDECTISSTITTRSINSGIPSVTEYSNVSSETMISTQNVDNTDSVEGFEQLQTRYHLLYLKAFEVQLCLDGLLRKKTSQVNSELNNEVDEICDTTLLTAKSANFGCATDEDLNINLSDVNSNSSSNISDSGGQISIFKQKVEYEDDNGAEGETYERSSNITKKPCKEYVYKIQKNRITEEKHPVFTNFDADSEGSDYENPNKILSDSKKQTRSSNRKSKRLLKEHIVVDGTATNNTLTGKKICPKLLLKSMFVGDSQDTVHSVIHNSLNFPLSIKQSSIINTYTRCEKSVDIINGSLEKPNYISEPIIKLGSKERKLPNKWLKPIKQKQTVDVSKFNRSNRKSKNCAIFYFKHTDTENEINNDCKEFEKNTQHEVESEKPNIYPNGQNVYLNCVDDIKETDDMYTNSPQNINLCSISLPLSASKSNNSNCSSSSTTLSQNKSQISHDSIKQLVLEAENLLRDEVYSASNNHNKSVLKLSTTVKKIQLNMPGPVQNRVEEWLEHQPLPITIQQKLSDIENYNTKNDDDFENPGEMSETGSIVQHGCDSSEGFSDSIATCMQTSTNSYENSNEIIGGSEPINMAINICKSSYKSLNINVSKRRNSRSNGERPRSVSCLSQLTTDTIKTSVHESSASEMKAGLTSFSMSESALDSISQSLSHDNNEASSARPLNTNEYKFSSKGSLKRRKIRKKKQSYEIVAKETSISQKKNGKSTESVSVEHSQNQEMCEISNISPKRLESEDEQELMQPNFRVGLLTTAYIADVRLNTLPSLGATVYNHAMQCENTTGNEDHHSSFSETAWDNYQEKYNSENYSEGFDSDAARRLLEFGDDYRNFIDSQSDCCSSVSARNNLNSLSPQQMDSLQSTENKVNEEDSLGLVGEQIRKHALRDNKCKPLQTCKSVRESFDLEQHDNGKTRNWSLKSTQDKCHAQMLRKTSESDTSGRRRKATDERRRSSRNLEKVLKQFPSSTTSSNYNDSDDEKELFYLLQQSQARLDSTNSLKTRCHLLRPKDYTEIITTCRDNIRCLETVLTAPSSTIVSAKCFSKSKDLLGVWEDLLNWTLNAEIACKFQDEIRSCKEKIEQLGITSHFDVLDTEPEIVIAVEKLKDEQIILQGLRKSMWRLSSSANSLLKREEFKFDCGLEERPVIEVTNNEIEAKKNGHDNDFVDNSVVSNDSYENDMNIKTNKWGLSENILYTNMRKQIGDLHMAWDAANIRIIKQLEKLNTSLITLHQLESELCEFQQTLGLDRGTLKGIEVVLDNGETTADQLAQHVNVVVKLLSEKVNLSQEQLTAAKEILDANHIINIAKYTASNGSLSDSGISDGGTTSDGGLSERERRLGTLRRLAKQLENTLAPGSEAMKSIVARIELAEMELKILQNACRDLILRTAETHKNKKRYAGKNIDLKIPKDTNSDVIDPSKYVEKKNVKKRLYQNSLKIPVDQGTSKPAPDDISSENLQKITSDESESDLRRCKRSWAWRVAKAALPMQVVMITFLCAACVMQPNCCENINNFAMSFSPHLHYIRGPPPL